jgi:hypothetical protein
MNSTTAAVGPAWPLVRDLVVVLTLLAGYIWLALLDHRHRALSRRLDLHTCPARQRSGAHRATRTARPIEARQPVLSVADLQNRPDMATARYPSPRSTDASYPARLEGLRSPNSTRAAPVYRGRSHD